MRAPISHRALAGHTRARACALAAFALAALALAACGAGDEPEAEVVEELAATNVARPPCRPVAAADSVEVPAEPMALAEEYLRRDAAGQLLDWTPWLAAAVACPRRDRTPNHATVIRDQQLRALDAGPDTVRVLVTATVLGRVVPAMAGTGRFRPDPGERVDTLVIARTDAGWRIAEYERRWYVLADSVPAHFPLDEGDLVRLRAMMR